MSRAPPGGVLSLSLWLCVLVPQLAVLAMMPMQQEEPLQASSSPPSSVASRPLPPAGGPAGGAACSKAACLGSLPQSAMRSGHAQQYTRDRQLTLTMDAARLSAALAAALLASSVLLCLQGAAAQAQMQGEAPVDPFAAPADAASAAGNGGAFGRASTPEEERLKYRGIATVAFDPQPLDKPYGALPLGCGLAHISPLFQVRPSCVCSAGPMQADASRRRPDALALSPRSEPTCLACRQTTSAWAPACSATASPAAAA